MAGNLCLAASVIMRSRWTDADPLGATIRPPFPVRAKAAHDLQDFLRGFEVSISVKLHSRPPALVHPTYAVDFVAGGTPTLPVALEGVRVRPAVRRPMRPCREQPQRQSCEFVFPCRCASHVTFLWRSRASWQGE